MLKEKEIAEYFGTTYKNISVKKKDHYEQYELIRLGSICKKYNITEDKLKIISENDNLDKALKILKIIKE